MKKFLTLLCAMVTGVTFAQNGATEILVPPTTSQPYMLLDTNFYYGSTAQGFTDIYVHFANPTSDDITGVQFSLAYDTSVFSAVQVYWGPTATSITDKYGSYYATDTIVNVTGIYTGTTANFNWADGAMFRVHLTHSPSFVPTNTDINFTPSNIYTPLATTDQGIDVALGYMDYGGWFSPPPLNFPVYAFNMDGSPLENMSMGFVARSKDSSNWNAAPFIYHTDVNGESILPFAIDTTSDELGVIFHTDTVSDYGALTVTDAYRLAQIITGEASLSAQEFYTADINETQDVTVSDAYLVFNRLALADTNWYTLLNNTYNVAILSPAERQAALAATSIPDWALAPRVYRDTIIINGMSQLDRYFYAIGDVTNSGINNSNFVVAKMADSTAGTSYILDPAVYLQPNPDSIQFHIPKLTMTDLDEMKVPISVLTFGNKVGALQVGIEFDNAIFEFNGVEVGDVLGQWNSFTSVEDGKVLWGGHENAMAPGVIEMMKEEITFVFDVKDATGWQTSPLKIYSKSAGDENAYDLSIIPSPNDGSVVNKTSIDPGLLDLMEGFRVFPNPTSAETFNWIFFEFHADLKDTDINGYVMDMSGKQVMTWNDRIYTDGFQFMGFSLEELPNGMYFLRLRTDDRDVTYKVIKK